MSDQNTKPIEQNPEGDVTGEHAARAAYDGFLKRFEELLKEAFANAELKTDRDLVEMLTDEMHGKIDEALTEFYASEDDDGLNVDDLEDESDGE